MKNNIKTDFHLHSKYSDGAYSPDELALLLKRHDIKIASLTDHNSMNGLEEFKSSLEKYNIFFVSGTEINLKISKKTEIHLLVYGLNINNIEVYNYLDKLDYNNYLIKDIFDFFHKNRGYIFIAHPLFYFENMFDLEELIIDLKHYGLDGLECYYKNYKQEEIDLLCKLAQKYDLLITGGSDFHSEINGINDVDVINPVKKIINIPGIDIPADIVKNFWI